MLKILKGHKIRQQNLLATARTQKTQIFSPEKIFIFSFFGYLHFVSKQAILPFYNANVINPQMWNLVSTVCVISICTLLFRQRNSRRKKPQSSMKKIKSDDPAMTP